MKFIQGKIIKKFKSKKGNDVFFRYPKKEDLDDMLVFVNGLIDEDTFVMVSGKHISRTKEKKFLDNTLSGMKKGNKIQLVATVNGKFAGNCELRRGERRKRHVGDIGIALSKAYREEGIGRELLKTLLHEGKKLGLRLLTISCMEHNSRALHVYESVGFTRAGMIPGAFRYRGRDVGEIFLSMPLRKE